MSVGLLPSLAIGVVAYGAGELILRDNKKEFNLEKDNIDNILQDARNKNQQISKIIPLIEDEELVNNIKEINNTVNKIIDTVEKKNEKYEKISNFFNYYLPVTINILNRYDEIENQKLTTEESQKFMKSSKDMVIKINEAFKKQLSNLYQSDMIDTDAEMKVFQSMLESDGYSQDDDFNIK